MKGTAPSDHTLPNNGGFSIGDMMNYEVPKQMQDMPSDATLEDVIHAINLYRAQERAIYLAPSLQWSDNQNSSI
jgi:hypothetical protein